MVALAGLWGPVIISGHAVEIVNYNNSLPEGTDKNLDLSLYIIVEIKQII